MVHLSSSFASPCPRLPSLTLDLILILSYHLALHDRFAAWRAVALSKKIKDNIILVPMAETASDMKLQ